MAIPRGSHCGYKGQAAASTQKSKLEPPTTAATGRSGPANTSTASECPEIPSIVCSTDSGANGKAKAAIAGAGSYSGIGSRGRLVHDGR